MNQEIWLNLINNGEWTEEGSSDLICLKGFIINLVLLLVCRACVEVRGQLAGSVLSFYHVGPENQSSRWWPRPLTS